MDIINIARAGVIADAPPISNIGMNVLSFLLSVVGIIAIMMLVVAGIMYFTSFGDKKRMQSAKKTAKYSVLGIILISGSMVLIKMVGQFFAK